MNINRDNKLSIKNLKNEDERLTMSLQALDKQRTSYFKKFDEKSSRHSSS